MRTIANDNLGEAIVEIRADLSRLAEGLSDARRQTNRAATRMERRTQTMSQRMRSAFRNVSDEAKDFSKGLSAVVAGVGAGLVALGVGAVKMAAEFEQTEVAFTTLLGSGEKAKSFLDDLADFAAKTPFDLKGLQGSARSLLAFGFEADNILPIMTSLGDAVSAMGGGAEEIDRATKALGKIA